MTWLTILLSILTLTVDSRTAVTATGDIPPSAEVSYNCSNQKGTVLQGGEAVLELSHLAGMTVSQVEVYIRSNQSGGGGTWSVSIDDRIVATKGGSFDQWFGEYDNKNYHALSLLPKAYTDVQEMTVRLQGSDNSIHIDRYVISYTPAPAHSVTLMRGNEVYQTLTESYSGAGVFLPAMSDEDGWRFVGWSETEFEQTATRPALIDPKTQCYLLTDITLWAAYESILPEDSIYLSELTDGEYLYTNSYSNISLAGVPDNSGRMETKITDRTNLSQQYTFSFTPAKDTAYITHAETGAPIGYDTSRKLVTNSSPWRVYHEGSETILYATIAKKNYVLWLNIQDLNTGTYYAGLLAAEPQNSPLKLVCPATQNEMVYTCHPESGMGFDKVQENHKNEYIFPFGNYDLIIRNGEKELRLR